jgi:hypothetical protein
MQSLSNLEELILQCRTERSRDLVGDAFGAYRAGAYRAAIVTTWIAVVFDIIDKLRELAATGDKSAKSELANFDGYVEQLHQGNHSVIKNALEFERRILTTARDKFLLFDQHQFIDLERLRDDRNRCAHPTFQRGETAYHPSAELARTHIRNAIVHVLQQPPVQGKAAMDSVETAILSEFFPIEPGNAVLALEDGPLKRASETLTKGIVDRFLFGLFTKGSPHHARGRTISALQAILKMHPSPAEPQVKKQIYKIASGVLDSDLHILVGVVSRIVEAREGLSAAQIQRLLSFLQNTDLKHFIGLFPFTKAVPDFAAAAQKRIDTMDQTELVEFVRRWPVAEAVERAVELYSCAGNFTIANAIADELILPLMHSFTASHVYKVFRSPRERGSDLKHSFSVAQVVDKIRTKGILPDDELDKLLREEGFDYLLPPSAEAVALSDDDIEF